MDRQHIATFRNREGRTLVGIVHEPIDGPRREVAILLLSPGVKNRVAPHRLYNKMAAEYVRLGFWVLRFDFYGLGDSEGELPERLLADLYGSIQLGRYVDDTRDAMDWMRRTHGFSRFILGGLCGGAITGVLAGADDPAVVGILGLGLPVILDGSSIDKIQNMTAGQLSGMRRRYARKLLSAEAWRRLLTFRSDFRLIARALTAPFRAGRAASGPPSSATPATAAPTRASNVNPLFPPACLRLLSSGRPMLLLFSGADRLYFEFEEKFHTMYRDDIASCRGALDVEVVANANHVFTFRAWQEEMLARSAAWLVARFPSAHEAPSSASARLRPQSART